MLIIKSLQCRATIPRAHCKYLYQRKTCFTSVRPCSCWVTFKNGYMYLSANFRASLIHLETVELGTSTYDWIKLNSNRERLFTAHRWYVCFRKKNVRFMCFTTQWSLPSVIRKTQNLGDLSRAYNLYEVYEK